ncbi:hypothetical protein [Actinomadura sp. WMMA1423]|uniref:hypothetical protein n=1 Tax=Actinomadura sp. WMMA1423 TaxID=2591108 RepID=UPI001147529F|nr:hypothetical protein [Actinomadura sp. WMMA1423]
MGVDWVRMRPRPGISATSLDAAIRAQAAAFLASGHWFADEFGHLPHPTAPEHGAQIIRMVEVAPPPGNSHRVNALVLTPLLPAEWRFAMYRSFHPGELGRHVRRWRTHIEEVRDGDHQAYLNAWYAYAVSQRIAEPWAVLRRRAADAGTRTNAWAVRPALVDVRERILALAEPAVRPPPRWSAPARASRPPAARPIDPSPFVELAREWNRRVPANQKVHVAQPLAFEAFLEETSPDETLQWLEEAAAQGYGLLLDW